MARSPSPAKSMPATPWWLSGEDEEGRACGQRYARETGVVCVECDEPICSLCACFLSQRPFCSGGTQPTGE